MNPEENITPMRSFNFEGREQSISFVKTMHETDGVDCDCDVYRFDGDISKDLGIIKIKPGGKTPLQRVLYGDRTVEGYISGEGKLTIIETDGKQKVYIADNESKKPIVVNVGIGELMQWEADKDSDLLVYEVCFPPYKDGRYENLK